MNREEAVKKAKKAVCWYRKHRDWLTLADRALRSLYYARDGNPARLVAAGVSITADVVNKAFPETSMEEDLRQRGYHLLDTPIGGLLCDILAQNGTPAVILEKGHKETAKLWEKNGAGAAAVYYNDEYQSGPYILGGDEQFLLNAVMRQVWSRGTDLMLTINPDTNIRKGSKRFSLVPIPDPGPYIGEPGPAYYSKRLSSYGNRPRTLLLKGPSGIGKSVLARHIASLSTSGSSRTLKIAGSALSSFGSAELRDLARFLQPSVMLLDDLNIAEDDHRTRPGREKMLDVLLDVLEALRVQGCLVIATMMVSTDRTDDRYRGDNYVEGMRPGRIDEIVTMFAPEDKERGEILEYYYKVFGIDIPDIRIHNKIIKLTDGLTGAYLREVAERVRVHGVDNLAEEIEAVLQASPPPVLRPPRLARARIRRTKRKPRTAKQLNAQAKRIEKSASKLRKDADKAMALAEKCKIVATKRALKEAEEKAKAKKESKKKASAKKPAEKKEKGETKIEPRNEKEVSDESGVLVKLEVMEEKRNSKEEARATFFRKIRSNKEELTETFLKNIRDRVRRVP